MQEEHRRESTALGCLPWLIPGKRAAARGRSPGSIPLVLPAYPGQRLQAAVELLLAIATVWIAFTIPTTEGAWSSPWTYAGGAATVRLMITYWARGLPKPLRRPQFGNGAVV